MDLLIIVVEITVEGWLCVVMMLVWVWYLRRFKWLGRFGWFSLLDLMLLVYFIIGNVWTRVLSISLFIYLFVLFLEVDKVLFALFSDQFRFNPLISYVLLFSTDNMRIIVIRHQYLFVFVRSKNIPIGIIVIFPILTSPNSVLKIWSPIVLILIERWVQVYLLLFVEFDKAFISLIARMLLSTV